MPKYPYILTIIEQITWQARSTSLAYNIYLTLLHILVERKKELSLFRYKDLLEEMEKFCQYGVETGIVGESELKQHIPYVFVGKKNGNYMIVQGLCTLESILRRY